MFLRFILFKRLFAVMFLLENVVFFTLENEVNDLTPVLEQMSSSNEKISLQCRISNYDESFQVHFHCSFISSDNLDDRCYENCESLNKQQQFLINCTRERVGKDVVLTYTSDKSTMPSGSYHCSYKGKSSHAIKHIKEVKKNITKEVTISTMSTKAAIEITTKIRTSIKDVQLTQQIRTDIALLLLAILTLSIIINVIFFVRCFIIQEIHQNVPSVQLSTPKRCLATCLCIEMNSKRFANYQKPREDVYDNIRDIPADSDTTKSKSSSGHDSHNILISPTSSQLTRSSTFPYRQSILVQTPTDQIPMSSMNMQPYLMQYVLEGGQYVAAPVLNHRLSAHGLYDDVPAESNSTMPIRAFSSTGSLNHRPKRFPSSQAKTSPLPEENQILNQPFKNLHSQTDEGVGFITTDASSTYDLNSSQGTYISGKESDSFKDPVRSAKLEMSREMMAKADTLLREAHNLLKQS